ncbi:MAG: hypothetical protein IT436_11435 [Phycisphaerales bacterium]|nr:hypothetical protein [Phycisphaerales bacterium]
MRLLVPALCVLVGLGHTRALAQTTPIDLASLPAEIKTLPWRDIDVSSLSPLERCRSLFLMSEVLDELRAQSTAEAELLSDYIDSNNLGAEFASQPPIADAAPLTMANGLQVAAALLRGPMAKSSYATQWGDATTGTLAAYEQLYQSSCQWKWSAMTDSRLRVRSMMRYLQATGKLDAYVAWVPGAVEKRTREQEAEAAQRHTTEVAQQQQQREKRLQQEQAQLQHDKQLQEQRDASVQVQQSLCAAQQSQNQVQSSGQTNVVDGAYPNWYYGGAAAVAAGNWYRNAAYQGAAQARTDARVASWHGRGGRR